MFDEAFAQFARAEGPAYRGGHHQEILFALYSPRFEENVLADLASQPAFGVDSGGRLVFNERLRRLTMGDLRRATASGLSVRDPNRLLAYLPSGSASEQISDASIAEFLNEHWEFLVPYALSFVYRLVPALRYRRIRRQVAQWHRQGIHDAWRIRTFLARRDEWTSGQVGKLVALDEPSAARLLKAMGYLRLETGLYVLGETDEAKRARAAWIEDEGL